MALSLAAFDTDDLAVISAHLQDARLQLSDVAYLGAPMRFVMVFHRKCREAPLFRPNRVRPRPPASLEKEKAPILRVCANNPSPICRSVPACPVCADSITLSWERAYS